jgi:hypothetical protein
MDWTLEVVVVPVAGRAARSSREMRSNVGFVFFRDPDGNSWAVQQISARGERS